MRVVVTGAAGFIGSWLSEKLLALGHEVIGIDCLTDYYPPEMKRRNLEAALANPRQEVKDIGPQQRLAAGEGNGECVQVTRLVNHAQPIRRAQLLLRFLGRGLPDVADAAAAVALWLAGLDTGRFGG